MVLISSRPRAVNSTFPSIDPEGHPVGDDTAQAVAAAILAGRYGLSPCMSRLVCYLADIGGRLA